MNINWQSYRNVAVVTASDTVDLPNASIALILPTASTNLKVNTAGGQTVDLGVVPAGILPIQVTRVYATPAPPAGIKALW